MAQKIQEDPRLNVLIKNVEFLSPDNVTLGKLKTEAPQVFAEYKALVENNAMANFEGKLHQDILRYEGIAATLANKYGDAEKLRELADNMKKEFLLGSGDYNNFMMAKLYDMAAVMVDQGESFKGNSVEHNQVKEQYLADLMKEAQSIAHEALENPSSIGNMRLEDHFIKEINENPVNTGAKEILSSDEYLKAFKAMAHWVVKFQFKKASLEITPMVKIDQYDGSSYERHKRVENYLVQEQFKRELDNFRQDKARRRAPYMRIQTAPGAAGEVVDSWNFVLEKFSTGQR
jgi:hypothetical protein